MEPLPLPPPAPLDPERKTLIDKLAMFVARNGHEFEKLTRNKQRHNPKFAFLFGGEYCNYFQYRVAAEKSGHHHDGIPVSQHQQHQLHMQPGYAAPPPPRGFGPQQAHGLSVPPLEQQMAYPPQTVQHSLPPFPQQPALSAAGLGYPHQDNRPQQQLQLSAAINTEQRPQQQQPATAAAGAAADPELSQLARQTGVPPEKLASVLDELLPPVAAASAEQMLAAFVMKRLQAAAGISSASAASASPALAVSAAPASSVATSAAAPVAVSAHTAVETSPAVQRSTSDSASDTAQAAGAVTARDEPTNADSSFAPSRDTAGGDVAKSVAPTNPAPAKPEVGGSSQNVTDQGPDAKRPRLDGPEAAPVAEHPVGAAAGSGSSSASLPTSGANSAAAAAPASDDGMDEIAALKRTVRDPDALFALSVAEALKRLPMEGKATLKIAIMEVVAEIRTAEKPPAEVTNGTAVSAPPETAAQAEMSAVPVEQVDISKPPPSVTGNVEEDNLSEAFFIGEEEAAAASRTREAVEESEPPLAPPVKKQCVPKSAPFADQLADAKARAAAMAREAAEQSRAAREMHLHVPPPGYGPPPPAGATPNGSVPPPGPPAGPAPGWPAQVPYRPGQPAPLPGAPYGQRAATGPPELQPIRPLMAPTCSLDELQQQQLSQEQIQQQIALLQRLASVQQPQQQQYQPQQQYQQPQQQQPYQQPPPQQQYQPPPQQQYQPPPQPQPQYQPQPQTPDEQIALQLQAAAVMGVEPKGQDWDTAQYPGQQVNGPASGQPAGWGRPLPAPAAAMPRGEPLQRAAAERRHRSPVRRFRR
ncbi:chromatin modification-related protein eaf-1-like isoform X1 [Amphibalanus amphitrite]|uniref:chromatin modification-related protein eaf-1-like isoform X1 n=1 Tax=Amphibalanus amphitrite TaxID=1232801 RepID=UPI001C9189FB|nr:chromatin modification-related protein eaf-1-like isoform X1 [Amphibalanus amphitrite]